MNERIKALSVQAVEHANNSWGDDRDIRWQNEYDCKFAELIVNEFFDCIDILEKIADSTNASIPTDYDKHTYLETLDTVRGLLKAHFGVE